MSQRGPNQPERPEACRNCEGDGFVGAGPNLQECPRCNGTGIEPEGLSKEEQTAIGAVGGGLLGYSLGGPAGALVGGLIGAALSQQEEDAEDTF